MPASEVLPGDALDAECPEALLEETELTLHPGLRRKLLGLCRRLPGRSALATLDQSVVSAANFLLLILVARKAGMAQTGYYVLALRAVDFITEIQNVFLWAPYTLFAPEYDEARRRTYAGSVVVHQIGATLVSLAIAGIVALGASFAGLHVAATVALWTVVASLGIHSREFARRFCFANLDFLQALAMDVGIFLLQGIGVAVLLGSSQVSGWKVLSVTSVAAFTGAWLSMVALRSRFQFCRFDVLVSFRKNFSYGRWLLGSDLTLLLSNQIYPWFLSAVSGPAIVALFGAAQAITNFARMFLIGAQNILLPSSARACANGDLAQLRLFVRRSTTVLTVGSLAFSLFYLAAGAPLLKMIYGSKFASHGLVTFLLSLTIVATAWTLAPTFALAAARRADANVKINVLTLLFHCIVGLLLARTYGAEGAAWGLALGGFLAALLRWRVYERLFSTSSVFDA